MNLLRTLLSIVLLVASLPLHAQIGGSTTYSFLNLPTSARIAAMGGTFISVRDNDLNLVSQNPGMLNPEMHGQIALTGVNYFADTRFGYVAYGHHADKLGTFGASIQFVDYGTFDEADATGEISGQFSAGDYALNLSWAKPLDSAFTLGVSLKTIYSDLYLVNSLGLAADVGAVYYNPEKKISASLVLRNMGRQITTYTEGNTEKLPFEIMAGISKRLANAPLRFSLNIRHLEKFDLTYKDPAKEGLVDPLTQEPIEQKFSFTNKVMRHLVPGMELLLGQNFHITFGYNYQRRQELGLESRLSTVGMSWGFGLRVSKFQLAYGRGIYHLEGGSNHLSITTALSRFVPKAQPSEIQD